MHKRLPLLIALPAAAILLAGCPRPLQTVDFVDLDRYQGLWYQVAGYPFGPSLGLVGITAEYTLLPNESVRVVNRGFEGSFDGPEDVIEGVARVTDPATNAKLGVSFPSVLGGFFEARYWIIDLDELDYQYAVVSDPTRTTLFVLHRDPTPGDEFLNGIIDSLVERGFIRNRIELTPQQDPA